MKFLLILIISSIILITKAKDIFMSTEGNDETGDGSKLNPFLTLMKCQEIANSGDTVYIRGGIYKNFPIAEYGKGYNYIHKFNKNFITYKSFNSEKVIFDLENNSKYQIKDGLKTQRVAAFYIPKGAKNITFEEFSVTGVPSLLLEDLEPLGQTLTQSECFQSRGQFIRFNRVNAYNNHAIGFYFVGTGSYNIAYRCDSYNNTGADKASKGNADGFGAHGTGAELIECRAWDNSDDNFDCIESYGKNIFDNCWAFKLNIQNTEIQDGNGFKIGGWGKNPKAKDKYEKYSGENPPVHIVKNCISTNNKANGFYANHQPGQAAFWFNNRAYNNKANFDMTEGSETWEIEDGKVKDICGTREVLFFNIAHKFSNKLKNSGSMYGTEGNLYMANIPEEKNQFNSWNFRDITIKDSDFISLDLKELGKERGPDGSLPKINFMKLNPNGPNYNYLKSIEDEMKRYDITNDGVIYKKK